MTILVSGATGTIGRHVVEELLRLGQPVRALTRDPATAELPAGVEVVQGDLAHADTLVAALDGVTAWHLITFDGARGAGGGAALSNGAALVTLAEQAGVRRITVLQNGAPGDVEAALGSGSIPVTVLQPVEFMANALEWSDTVRTGDPIEEPFVERMSAMVHEADIGAVAAHALAEDGHGGQTYVITGPEVLSLKDKIAVLAQAIGHQISLTELSQEEAVDRWQTQGFDEETIGFFLWIYGSPPEVGTTVTDTVTKVTGRPARSFASWARDHADAFRPVAGDVSAAPGS